MRDWIKAQVMYKQGELSLEELLESYAENGRCPLLLNDDAGHWALSFEGYQNVVMGDEPEDVQGSYMVEAEDWKDTIKEAVIHMIDKEDDE